MTNFTELTPVPFDRLVPFTDQLRLAVAAYLARFKGSSRDHTESDHLGGKVRELRLHLLRQQTRVTYWLAPGRRVILLTVFHKTRSAETAEVARALHAQKICETEHGIAHEVFDREVT
jgi:phage-related protein